MGTEGPPALRSWDHPINGICPYFTMFPLAFPLDVLAEAKPGDRALDPFCGRGTTSLASRILGLPSVGIDSNPVAVAIARAKLVDTSPGDVIAAAQRVLEEVASPASVPEGAFWSLAFHRDVLTIVCRL